MGFTVVGLTTTVDVDIGCTDTVLAVLVDVGDTTVGYMEDGITTLVVVVATGATDVGCTTDVDVVVVETVDVDVLIGATEMGDTEVGDTTLVVVVDTGLEAIGTTTLVDVGCTAIGYMLDGDTVTVPVDMG